ncbi:MAG: response regulator [Parvularculaceae bacterium]|nr:response regulator [Parvularculaceae bacterium]
MENSAKILVIDDDPIMCELAHTHLTQAGYTCRQAENGREGLTILAAEAFDLVISDVDMPVMNGYDLTRAIRSDARLSSLPVLVITASEQEDSVAAAFEAGATSFLSKPINWTLFSQAVKFVLKASKDQKELRVARDRAEAGARFKDSLMSVMSHELRTPLNAIIGFGQLLSEQFERENDYVHKEYSDYVVEGGKRLLNSVSDMLLASDARSGPIAINDIDCTLDELFELARSPLEKTLIAAGADLRTVVKEDGLEICCDRVLVARAISKLIDNAVKFSPRNVKVILGAALARSGDLAIMVRDNGAGVDMKAMPSPNETFAQLDMSLRRSNEGLGLGLPLVSAIAQAHGGRLKIESAPGEGFRAYIVMPASRVSTNHRSAVKSA